MTTRFQVYDKTDFAEVSALWARINRELAPPDMREQFEQYIQNSINDELAQADKSIRRARAVRFGSSNKPTRLLERSVPSASRIPTLSYAGCISTVSTVNKGCHAKC